VEDGPAIEKLVFNYVPGIVRRFDEIAELAGYIWYIDYEKRLHFTPKDRNTAPFGSRDDLAELAEPEDQREPENSTGTGRSSGPGRR
jgi:hypothetical protein